MTTFVLVPGAGGAAWYWHRVVDELQRLGHEAIAVDLPSADPDAGLADYVDAVVAGAGGRTEVVVVGQSLGGFSAPLACRPLRAVGLVLVNAMIPTPGETGAHGGRTPGSRPRSPGPRRVTAATSTPTPTSATRCSTTCRRR